MAESLAEQPTETAFDKGLARFTWLMVRDCAKSRAVQALSWSAVIVMALSP